MATFLDLRTKIASDLTRSDLDAQTKNAVQDAIKFYEPERFWFNQTRTLTFPTVIGRNNYGSSDLSQIPDILEIDKLVMRDATSQWDVEFQEPVRFEELLGYNTSNGRPTDYTRIDGQILFYPTPNAVFTARPIMHYRLPMLSGDSDSTAWCNEAENLIRAHAKLILYTNVIEDDAGSQRMQLQLPALRSRLDEETTSRMATGRIVPTQF